VPNTCLIDTTERRRIPGIGGSASIFGQVLRPPVFVCVPTIEERQAAMRARQRGPGRPALCDEVRITKAQIESLLELSADEIAKRLKVSYSTLCRHVARLWPGSNGRITDIRGHSYKARARESLQVDGSNCCAYCHRSWSPPKTREQRLEERLDIIENELKSCKFPPAWVPEQLSLFPIGFRDQLHMATLAKELREIPLEVPEKIMEDAAPAVLKPVLPLVGQRERRQVISPARLPLRSSRPSFLNCDRPHLPVPVRIMTAEELARL
jgi:hypothetical protein